MPADDLSLMEELVAANKNNTNGTQDVVANAIANIQSMPDCENLVKNVLKATTGFESLGEAAQQSGRSTSDILDRVASVFERITARANEAQASVYGFGSSFDKVKPNAFSNVEKHIKEIKKQADLTSASIGAFSKQINSIGNVPKKSGSSEKNAGSQADNARLKYKNLLCFYTSSVN